MKKRQIKVINIRQGDKRTKERNTRRRRKI